MRVLVVGIGNSAADTSTQLIGHAQKVYLSHRGGVKIVRTASPHHIFLQSLISDSFHEFVLAHL
jgi:hypothetical protein